MSMTAAEIAGVVGKDQQPWWPPLMWGDGEWWTRAEAKHVMPDLAELAFIGAAVRELAKRASPKSVMVNTNAGFLHMGREWAAIDGSGTILFGASPLHTLVAALNESEGA